MKPVRFLVSTMLAFSLTLVWLTCALAQDPMEYQVKEGDTLEALARKYLKDETLWPKLWELNHERMSNPNRLTVGDVLVIPSLQALSSSNFKVLSPPVPLSTGQSLYDRGRPMDAEFPRYFTFVADPQGISGSGTHRIKVKKLDPVTGETLISYEEAREVGMIIASADRGHEWDLDIPISGKLMLSYLDEVTVQFTEDLAKILDSETWEDPDPYFREYPIYGYERSVREPNKDRANYGSYLGQIMQLKGKLIVIARVESLAPVDIETTEGNSRLANDRWRLSQRNKELQPVSYVCRISYSDRPIRIGDRIFVFKTLNPGPDRVPCVNKLHAADSYTPAHP